MKWYIPTGIAAGVGGLLVYGLRSAFATTRSPKGSWHLTIPTKHVHVTSGWWDDRSYRGPGAKHEGIDIEAKIGTPVFAVADGTVISKDDVANSAAGKWISIQHADGLVSQYMHLSKIGVNKNQTVKAGQQLGLSGNTANPVYKAAPHLHLTLRLDPVYVKAYVKRFGKPKTGFGTTNAYGTAIPAETLVPVHVYDQKVIDRAKANGITSMILITG